MSVYEIGATAISLLSLIISLSLFFTNIVFNHKKSIVFVMNILNDMWIEYYKNIVDIKYLYKYHDKSINHSNVDVFEEELEIRNSMVESMIYYEKVLGFLTNDNRIKK